MKHLGIVKLVEEPIFEKDTEKTNMNKEKKQT